MTRFPKIAFAGLATAGLLFPFVVAAADSANIIEKRVRVAWNPVLGGGYRGAWNTGPGMSLISYYPVAANTSVVGVEAEAASVVLCHEDGGMRNDATASGGAFASLPKTVELFLEFETPGNYSVWYRVRFPGNVTETRHLEGVDASLGGSVGWVTLKKAREGWQWQKGDIRHTFKRKGRIELQMDQIPNGLELDTVVLAADENWTPEGTGQNLTTLLPKPWTDANLDTEDLSFAEVNAWGKVACAMDARDGKASLHYSADAGKSWNAVPADGILASVPVRADGRDTLRFRVSLSRKPGSAGPLVAPAMELSYRTPADSLLTVEDDLARYHFARRNGALCGIENKKTGTQIVPVGTPVPVFVLKMKKPGFLTGDQEKNVVPEGDAPDGHGVLKPVRPVDNKLETVTSLDAECVRLRVDDAPGAGLYRALHATYLVKRPDGGVTVELTVRFRNGGESLWTLNVANQLQELELCEAAYPVLNRIRIAASPAAESLLLFGNYLVQKPAYWGHFLYWWPGVSYPMLDVSSAQEGISLISHDTTLRSTGLSAQGQNRQTTRLELVKALCLRPGQSYAGPENLVRVHEGGWDSACFLEKDWAQKNLPLAESPLWADELDFFSMSGWPVRRWDRWSTFAAADNPLGCGLLGLWAFQVPGTHWSMGHPSPILGDEEDLRSAVRDFRRSGMRFIMYIQSLLWDETMESAGEPDDRIGYVQRKQLWPGWELPAKGFAQSNCLRDIYGKQAIYSPENIDGKYLNTPMDQASPGFADYKYRWAVDLYGKKLGLDGIYWDSDSGYFGSPSWRGWQDKDFDPGLTGKGAVDNALRIRRAYQAMRPDAVFVGEGTSSVAMHQARDFTLQNLYNVYPIKIMFPKLKMMAEEKNYDKAFLAGLCFIGRAENYRNRTAGSTVPLSELERYVGMRRLAGQFLRAGEFCNEKGIRIQGDGVEAKVFRLNDGRNLGFLLNILNRKQVKDGRIEVDSADMGAISHGWIIRDDLTEGPLAVPAATTPFRYSIPVPASAAAHILLLNRAEPRVVVSAGKPLVAGGQTTLDLAITSLTGRQTGAACLDMPERLAAFVSSDAVRFDVPAGETRHCTLTVKAGLTAPADIVTLPVRVTPDGSAPFQRPVSLYLHEPVDTQFDMVGPDAMRITVENRVELDCEALLTFATVKGTVTLEKGAFSTTVALKAKEKREFAIATRGAADAQAPWAIRGELTYHHAGAGDQRKEAVYRKFWPVIANGSLELCEFRKGAPEKEYYQYSKNPDKLEAFQRNIPDYWWGWQSDKSPQISLDPGWSVDEQADGAAGRCIRLGPDARVRIQDNHGRAVPFTLVAGRQYRFRARMKQTFTYFPVKSSAVLVGMLEHTGFAALTLDPAKHESGKWHALETTFVAPTDQAGLHLCSGPNATVWFDDLSVVPLNGDAAPSR